MSKAELLQKRAEAFAAAEAATRAALDEGRALTDEERAAYNQAMARVKELDGLLEIAGDLEDARGAIPAPVSAPPHLESPEIGMTDSEVRNYSIHRAILALADGNWRAAGLELEASRAVAKKLGREPRGFFIPADVTMRERRASDLTVGEDTTGGYLIDDEPHTLIEMLRNKTLVRAAGARMLANLHGPLPLVRQTSGPTIYWIAEDGSTTASGMTFEQELMEPKTASGKTQISRKQLIQNSSDVELFTRTQLFQGLAVGIDYVCLHGSGTDPEPAGIQNISGVATVEIGTDGGPLTLDHVVQLETEVAVDNADTGRLAYMTNPRVRGALKTTPKVSGQAVMLWSDGQYNVNGYKCWVTSQVRSDLTKGSGSALSAMFFGNWQELVIGLWGGTDVTVDAISQADSGALVVRIFQDIDVALWHPQSFAQILDIQTS